MQRRCHDTTTTECDLCHSVLPPRKKKYCSAECAKIARREVSTRFVGVDGEGVNHVDTQQSSLFDDGEEAFEGYQDYVLLSVGDRSLHKNGEPLDLHTIFEFLYDCFLDDMGAVYVGFYLSYDFNQWFRQLPEEIAYRLLTPDGCFKRSRGGGRLPTPVEWDGWEFDVLNSVRFRLRKIGCKGWMYICDVGGFFQTSFMNVIESNRDACTDDEYQIIKEGKEQRSTATFDHAMVRYNVTENIVLGKVMRRLAGGLTSIGVELRRSQWFGPGQAAQKWLSVNGLPTAEDVRGWIDSRFLERAIQSYIAGWFEVFQFGNIPGITYEYDINSAYPYAIANAPCLEHARMEEGGEIRPLSLVYGTYRSLHPSTLGAVNARLMCGSIVRPERVKSVMWGFELLALQRLGMIEIESTEQVLTLVPECDHQPFHGVRQLYEERLRAGKNGPYGVALKLVYNSLYGKLAQSVGSPKYANPIYASYITATCRTLISRAIGTHPGGIDELVMVATDAVFFRTPHPGLPLSDKLGEWDCTEHEMLTVMKPGVYWSQKAREAVAAGGLAKLKSRGIPRKTFSAAIGRIDAAFERMRAGGPWPQVGVRRSFAMVSCRSALSRGKWHLAGRVYAPVVQVSSCPDPKRESRPIIGETIRTRPNLKGVTVESRFYYARMGVPEGDVILDE